jgi:hypothetical protein
MTLDDVAKACVPPTTPQTVGRLETGTRTVSVGWLNRIAQALGVEAQDLVESGDSAELKVAAVLGPGGASAPKRAAIVVPPRVEDGQIAVIVAGGVGDYRSGDEIWCKALQPADYGQALNRDEEKLQILPLEAGGRQQVVANPPWLGVATRLVRIL